MTTLRNSRPTLCSRIARASSIAAVLLGAAIIGSVFAPQVNAQKRLRSNRLIEALEAEKPAITGDTWVFIDREHRPYSIDNIQTTLNGLFAKKNDAGQVLLAPIVRIPMEGDQESGWAIKQVLERGAMGIVIPHVETRKDMLRIVSEMRYPNQKGAKYPNPPGRRGCGCSGGSGWGVKNDEYLRIADVWPLNPDGELFFMPMIETEQAIKNINEILDTPGLGGPLVGPSDLTMSMGYGAWNAPGGHPETVEQAIQTVAQACVAKKKYCGMVTGNEAETDRYLKAGFKFIFATYRPNSSF